MDADEAMALSWGWQALFVMVDILAAAMRILFYYIGMVFDLHCQLLPGIDDGVPTHQEPP